MIYPEKMPVIFLINDLSENDSFSPVVSIYITRQHEAVLKLPNPIRKNTKLNWFKQYLFLINLHIQYILVYGTGFDKKFKLISIVS